MRSMQLHLIGLSHKTAPLEMRERLVFDPASLPEALERLSSLIGEGHEILLLSTCNRTEILLHHHRDSFSLEPIHRFLREKSGLPPSRLDGSLYSLEDEDAVRHIFRVACSLDSMVIGEPQILHQVKQAYACARREKRLGPIIDALLQRAFTVAKKVRSQTGIGRHPVSISHAAVELAQTIFGELADRKVLVMGAGKMSGLTLRQIMAGGVRDCHVATRRFQHGLELAQQVGAEAIPFRKVHSFLEEVDIVISSTAAPHHLLNRSQIVSLMRRRRNRPIFFIDIAVPRDIDPAVNDLDNVYLYDLDDLEQVVNDNMEERRKEGRHAEAIIDEEVIRFRRWFLGLSAGPVIKALRVSLHQLRDAEFSRLKSQLHGLTVQQMDQVERFSRTLVNKILHQPTAELKRSLDGRSAPGQVALVRRLFQLSEPVEAEERADHLPDLHGDANDEGTDHSGEEGDIRAEAHSADSPRGQKIS
ncbi:MAG: glutamyl-tRNA reductase [Acidobacteriota bacterium]